MASTDTSRYKFNHSMLRVKDPARSIKFYELLGMKLIDKLEQKEAGFDLYFLAYDGPHAVSHGHARSDREGLIELTHNHGTETSDWQATTGNSDPGKGFGHLCISVDNIQAACKRIEDAGYKFQKKLTDGRMKSIAFALDPDLYWIELISFNNVEETEHETTTDVGAFRMNHTMLRIKDPKKALHFYQDIMGMKLLRTSEQKEAKFTLFFLGYGSADTGDSSNGVNPLSSSEGLLELTWNHGTESDPNFKGYHNGNDEPQGFGHICVSVDNLEAACARFEEKGVKWKKRLTDGRMKNIAFILDEDNYWIEVIGNEKLKSKV